MLAVLTHLRFGRAGIIGVFARYLVLLAVALPALAQVPTGGYVPRAVQHLERVAEPPGGLIPYRSGGFWGYADTTGQVVIAPVFERQPDFFLLGFGQVLEGKEKAGSSSKERRMQVHSNYRFVNARGETMRGDDTHAVLLLPDSSLQLVERHLHVAQPGLTAFFRDDYRKAGVQTERIEPLKGRLLMMNYLGNGRTIGYKRQNLPPKAYRLAPQLLRGALLDGQQHRLTRFAYAQIYPFQQGFARFEYTGSGRSQWGLMNRSGHEFLRHYDGIEGPFNNRVIVLRYDAATQINYSGIVDTTGRIVSPVQAQLLHWLVPGKIIMCYPNAGSGDVCLLSPDGKRLFKEQLFKRVTRFSTDRILVDCIDGASGVLSSDLQWIIPCQAQQLALLHDRYDQPDSTVILVIRAGKKGILSMRDGRVIAPGRYETVYGSYYNGEFYGARRAGKDFILNRYGREIIEARPANGYYGANEQRRLVISTPLLAVVRPNDSGGLIGLIDSSGRARSTWQPFLKPGQRDFKGHVFDYVLDGAPGPATALPSKGPFTALPRGWLVSDSLLINPYGKRYAPPAGATWRTRMTVGQYYEAAPFELGVYPTDKGFVTRRGTRIWAH